MVIVFAGPTLSSLEVSQALDATVLPPAAQGDVYRAALQRPSAIGIIDGYFEHVPAVWHKEILWAMSQGIHVFGSASMGALRAAELACFGMTGVGAIFEAFRDGLLEDDDEVAVAHGLAENGYRAASEATVNIRATLVRAQELGILDTATACLLLQIAKELFYPERSYPHILRLAETRGAPCGQLDAVRQWLPRGAVNQKREDALLMLRTMREFLKTGPDPMQVSWVLEETFSWEVLKRCSAEIGIAPAGSPDARVLEELRRNRTAMERATAAALGWQLAAEAARRQGYTADAAVLLHHSAEFCRAHDLPDRPAVTAWLERNHCSQERLEELLASRALTSRMQELAPSALDGCLLDYLRWTGDYAELLANNKDSRAGGLPGTPDPGAS